MKILYIDGVAPFGGASRSLYEVLSAMPPQAVRPYFVAARGSALDFYREIAYDSIGALGLTRFDHTEYSYYRGLRWLVVARELAYLPATIAAMLAAKRRWRAVDVIHVNEFTEILPGLVARWLFKAPLVIHVRSVVRNEHSSRRSKWLTRQLKRRASAVIAIDETVRTSLPPDLSVDVIHNSFAPQATKTPDTVMIAKLDSLPKTALRVGFMGNLLHVKGLLDLVEAARILRDQGCNVQFAVVGDSATRQRGLKAWLLRRLGLAQDLKTEMLARIDAYGLQDCFHMLGPTRDIQSVYQRIDVLCFPSHYDAPGRPIFEAAFFAVPSIAAVRNPKPDTLVDGVTGLAIPPRDPVALAAAIQRLLDAPEEVARMGGNAKQLAESHFVPQKNAQTLLRLYSRLTASPHLVVMEA